MTGPFVPVGRVVRAHGLKGEVSVKPFTDLPFDVLIGVNMWFAPPTTTVRDGVLKSVRQGPKGPLATFSTLTSIQQSSALNGATIMAREEDLPDGWDDEIPDPVGLTVIDETRGELGIVTEEILTGANDVWVIEGPSHGTVLLPVIDDVVLEVDWDTRIARVRVLPGLIDGE